MHRHTQREDSVRTQEEAGHLQLGEKEASEGTSPAGTWISDSQPPERVLFKPPGVWYFVTASLADYYGSAIPAGGSA